MTWAAEGAAGSGQQAPGPRGVLPGSLSPDGGLEPPMEARRKRWVGAAAAAAAAAVEAFKGY